ncbi:hypothetical protein [Jeotgalibacillus haloalkalitolerans]|uniref:Uncharacterized protein n=1 Tax=Jeotgalibacillus haloalkalitolerans TaxID=3104292 RepID=A0ABU5KJW5_9BACL|nr:hypothetical protein [Jeotgalibacillus sp. HH7-29]MDZ5711373.1 hypothetical protein [Jeotgalibacillus sp. HH7-29]
MDKIKKIVRNNWDEIGIATALGHFYSQGSQLDMEKHGYIIEALKRSNQELANADVNELQAYLQSLEEEQLTGLISNIKGIAHEVYYIEIENEDDDAIYAYMFEDTNHEDYDIVIYDESGSAESYQMKATDSEAYANQAIEEVGKDQVILTEELAEKLGTASSGISNKELTADVELVVDQLIENPSLWNYLPALSAWSIALIAASLTKRYINKQIDRKTYFQLMTIYCGAKVSKLAIIVAALSIPGVNIVAGAVLFLKVAFSVKNTYSL